MKSIQKKMKENESIEMTTSVMMMKHLRPGNERKWNATTQRKAENKLESVSKLKKEMAAGENNHQPHGIETSKMKNEEIIGHEIIEIEEKKTRRKRRKEKRSVAESKKISSARNQ